MSTETHKTETTDPKAAEPTRSVDDLLADPNATNLALAAVDPDLKAVDIRRGLPNVAVNARETARLLFSRVPRIDELRPQIVSELPRHPIDKHDRIAQFALVFLYAYQQWQLVAADPAAFDALLAECTDLRKRMLVWAPTAVLWKVFTQAELDAILGGSGHSDIADDTSVLGRMSLERWASLEAKVGYTHADAERAVVAGQQLFKALGGKDAADESAPVRAAKEQWQRAFVALSDAWAEVVSAVRYVRRHDGDADEIAPSLFSTRKAGRKASKAAAEVPAASPADGAVK